MGRDDEGWRDPDTIPRKAPDNRLERHCGKPGCLCRHDHCYRGWIDYQADGKEWTAPCRTCRPTTSQKVAAIPPPGQRSGADFSVLRGKSGFNGD